jgi:hypothetical protein
MRSLPETVQQTREVVPRSIAASVTPFLGIPAGPAGARRLEDAALILLAAVYAQHDLVREQLTAERLPFDRLVHTVNRCPATRGGTQ